MAGAGAHLTSPRGAGGAGAGLPPTPALTHAERSWGGPARLAPRASSRFPRGARPGLPLPRAVSSAPCPAAGGALPSFGAATPRGSMAARRLRVAAGSNLPRAAALLRRPGGAAPGNCCRFRAGAGAWCYRPPRGRLPGPESRWAQPGPAASPRVPAGRAEPPRRWGSGAHPLSAGRWPPPPKRPVWRAPLWAAAPCCSGEKGSPVCVAGDPSLSLLKLLLGRTVCWIWLLWKPRFAKEGAEAAARLSGGQAFPAVPIPCGHCTLLPVTALRSRPWRPSGVELSLLWTRAVSCNTATSVADAEFL